MARTATRRHKGCPMCKPYKDVREAKWRRKSPVYALRRLGGPRSASRAYSTRQWAE